MAVALVLTSPTAQASDLNPTAAEIDAFLGADLDQDRHLNMDEFRAFVAAMADAGQSTSQTIRFFGVYEFAFGVVDSDEDGLLSPDELRSADEAHRAGTAE